MSRKYKYFSQVLEAIQQKEAQLKQINYKELQDSYQRISTASLVDSVIALERSIILPLQESISKYKRLKEKALGKSVDWNWVD